MVKRCMKGVGSAGQQRARRIRKDVLLYGPREPERQVRPLLETVIILLLLSGVKEASNAAPSKPSHLGIAEISNVYGAKLDSRVLCSERLNVRRVGLKGDLHG